MYGAGVYEYYFRAYYGSVNGHGMVYATPDDNYLRYIARDDSQVKVYEYVMKDRDGVVVRT
jgi:hypothetical protein